ncbi:SDR family oxidoreductase [Salinibacterium sp. UTAS2018]|uniref:SDR family NAD(P)-dependent oxidoreductase n=1 Tax=Salinibacterium sp. UTAS2018 TaxID=2508880 RepID=UPI0010097023|nr:SDR family oxidoreductase [Salinibacterium sp. UTAS2018]QAV70057.1 SDR family oxidoreductase [Salinibacterium sp. UTAS2018]
MMSLSGLSILVVGSSGGLGSAISRCLADEGARLTLHARSEASSTATAALGTSVYADLRDPAAAGALVAAALDAYGQLDGVVNAAGLVAFGPAALASVDTVDDLFAVNTAAPMSLLRAAHSALLESAAAQREPFFVTLSGIVSESPTANMAAYSASKAALAAFGQAAGRELRREGVRLLDARPGHTETGLATRPIHGEAPRMPQGMEPDYVARRIVDAIIQGEKDLPSGAFHTAP